MRWSYTWSITAATRHLRTVTMSSARESLPPGTIMRTYQVVETIGRGGFSLIYLAHDLDSGEEVVLKEYIPKQISMRDEHKRIIPGAPEHEEMLLHGRKLFFQEARYLASLHHPHIVRVLGFFLENNTAYLVMPNERGRNLATYLQQRRGGLSTSFILDIFIPILDALALMHNSAMVHLDVKPGNIHLRHGNYPLLLDLGAVHPLKNGRKRGGQVITAGYSPIEQYSSRGEIGAWSDIYAVGASIRTCMERKTPQPAIERARQDELIPLSRALKDRYPAFLLEAVDWTMAMDAKRRPRDASELLATLSPYLDSWSSMRFDERASEISIFSNFKPEN